MAPADVLNLLRTKPFNPFRIVTTDGTTYDVNHPELVMVSVGSAVVGYPDHTLPGAFQRYDIVSMRHIIRLEPQPQPIPASGNGQVPEAGN